ncbi:hypothetical protein ACNKU7_01990 [Microbulbifer sp. SA54]|uniref:hypothetical protein n=1 Tax=Microbulbifer sp. SA54 TaxID=3401577 RepID=UPI003AAD80AC
MAKRISVALCALGLLCAAATEAEITDRNSVKLVALSSSENQRTGLGIDFAFQDIELGFINASARGIYSFDDDIRAQDLMHFGLDTDIATTGDCYETVVATMQAPIAIEPGTIPQLPEGESPRNRCPFGSWQVKGAISYETDQEFHNKNTVAGLTAAWEMPSAQGSHVVRQFYSLLDFVPSIIRAATGRPGSDSLLLAEPVMSLTVGQVDPQEDEVREQLLGKLDSYYRAAAEISMTTPLAQFDGRDVILAYDYRYYRELDAEQAIVDANLHRSRLLQFSLRIPSDNQRGYAFVGYASGRLPFGVDDEVLQLGWNYQL